MTPLPFLTPTAPPSSFAMGSQDDWPKRPLTEDELASLHGAEPDIDHIPGLPRTPWLKLIVVFTICSLAGFGLAYAAVYWNLV
jgi:hypothetical protein